MARPKATAKGSVSGPPVEVVVSVDGAPVAVVFSLYVDDPTSPSPAAKFGPSDPIESRLEHPYQVPGPTWWQNGKVVLCQVDGEPGPWTENRARLTAIQAGAPLDDNAWDVIEEDDPDGIQFRLTLRLD